MPRVLLVFEPPDGGVADHVLQIACGIEPHGWTPEVAGPEDAIVRPRIEAAGVRYHPVALQRGYRSPPAEVRALRAVTRLARREGYDVIHTHSSKAGVTGRLAAKAARTPTAHSPHCFGFLGEVGLGQRVFATGVEWTLGHSATGAIVACCETERDRAKQRHLAAHTRLRRIYYGVPDPPDVPVDHSLVEFAEGGLLVGAVCALRRQKRLDVLIDAAPSILQRVPDARVAIVGNGELEGELRAHAAEVGLDAEPRFGFFRFEAPSARHLEAMDLFTLPSGWEAMPIAVLEALASGIPQVATDVEGTWEACADGETGRLVPAGDATALGDAIVALLSDADQRTAMAAASSARHRERFAVDRMLSELASLYSELAR
jgi:glycosyltransferase involved in cell wall biosynthesis